MARNTGGLRAYAIPTVNLGSADHRIHRIRLMYTAMLPLPCRVCGVMIRPGDDWDVGHRIPKAHGGTDEVSNLWPEHRWPTPLCPGNRHAGRRIRANGTARTPRPPSRDW